MIRGGYLWIIEEVFQISEFKPVYYSKTVQRWFQRHRSISSERISSIVRWSEHPKDKDLYELVEIVIIKGKPRKITVWVREFSWSFLVYKLHMEST